MALTNEKNDCIICLSTIGRLQSTFYLGGVYMKTLQKKQGNNRAFGFLQMLSQAFMTPIAILPLAGMLLGVGAALQTGVLVEAVPWLSEGIWPYIAQVLKDAGNTVFGNLGLIFAIGVAMGMCANDGVAGLSGAIGYLIMNKIIGTLGRITPELMALPENKGKYTTILGMPTLQMGVFGGILIGFITAMLYKKYHKMELPQFLAFFQGKRFVMIITAAVSIIAAAAALVIWPYIQGGLTWISSTVVEANQNLAAFVYGVATRSLIPLGLHHVWNVPFWYMFGSYTTAAGEVVAGDYNIYFAQFADGVPVTAGVFLTGGYVMKIFALPAAAYAMYKEAKPEKKKQTAGLLLSVALTAAITGITEPIEFVILFAAFPLYIFYCITAGLAFMVCNILQIRIGMTFAGGLIDFTLLGVLQNMPNWVLMIPVGIAFAVLYYFVFRWAIRTFDFKTPGREDDMILNSEGDGGADSEQLIQGIIEAFGGKDNIDVIGACLTRLRVTVIDKDKVRKDDFTSKLGATGVMEVKGNLQVVYGPKAQVLCDKIKVKLSE